MQRFTHSLGLSYHRKPKITVGGQQTQSILELASHELRPLNEMAARIITLGLKQWQSYREMLYCWKSLTPRETEVARLICKDLTSVQIGKTLSISTQTARSHIRSIYHKLGVHSKSELHAFLGMLDLWELQHRQDEED